ncbi:hypothetical protein L484_025780 [Morus notabilis]|uniref:Uncharacterized protein n=1 Tax=Morus notabilis TaxID=981085 RepID=W9R431_9ROSA|nr:hypothetical protein L484_025780 [Morus notabilis]
MAVLFVANASHYSTTNNESFPFQNSLFHIGISVPCTRFLLHRRRYSQNCIFHSPFSLRRRLAPPFPSRPVLGLGLCFAAKPGHPPPPPQSDPPPEPPRLTGTQLAFSSSVS